MLRNQPGSRAAARGLGCAVGAVVFLLAGAARAKPTPAPSQAQPAAAPAENGWANPKALDLAKEAVEAKKAGDYPTCVQKDQLSLAVEDHPYVRLHLSSCLVAQRRYKDALVSARDALAAGIRTDDEDLKRGAQQRVQEILPKLAHVRLKLPPSSEGLTVTLNGVPLRPHQLKERITLDPGPLVVEALREEKGERYSFNFSGTLGEGEDKTVEVLPRKDNLPGETEQCLRDAQSYEDKLKCIGEKRTRPTVNVGLSLSGYTDSVDVHCVTPAINAAVASPTGGWNVGGSYLVDVVSAASPDIVSTASRAFKETRHAGTLGGGYKPGRYGVNAYGNVSREPDYLSITGGGAVTGDFADKHVTPRLGYAYRADKIGIKSTPFDQFQRNLAIHEIEAGATFVLSPTDLLVAGVSVGIERGENSKLYRFVPMFSAEAAAEIRPGEAIQNVDATRLSFRAREVLPRTKDRIAVGVRYNHRFPVGTLRLDERVYTDSWGIKASTTDARYLHDIGSRLRVWPHLRFHAQSGASFYQLAYVGAVDADQPVSLPRYRTTDRELSPMFQITVGAGARIALTDEKADTKYAIVVAGDLMHGRYSQSLFIVARTAYYGTVGFEAEF